MKISKGLVTVMILICFRSLAAQDYIYTQFFASQPNTNPAMVGTHQNDNGDEVSRFSANYRNFWPSNSRGYQIANLSWDKPISVLGGGVGIMINKEFEGGGMIASTSISGTYSYLIPVNNKLFINAGLELGLIQRTINTDNINVRDLNDPLIQRIIPKLTYPNFAAGLVTYTKDFYAGFAIHNLLAPNVTFIENSESKLARRYTLHGGGVINLANKNIRFYPDLQLNVFQNDYLINMGINAKITKIIIGYGTKGSFNSKKFLFEHTGILGFKNNKILAMYSLGYSTGQKFHHFTHELSLRFSLYHKSARQREIRVSQTPWL